jgi:hypothetical protein
MVAEHPEHEGLRRRTVLLGAVAKALLVVAVVAMLAMLTWIAVQNRGTLVATRRAQVASIDSQQRLVDCTTPGHSCYDESLKRQAAVIGDPPAPINNVVILAAACADRPGIQTETTIRACVLAGLEKGKP